MLKSTHLILASIGSLALSSCVYEAPPPPRFMPNPPYPPQVVPPSDYRTDISPPPAPSLPQPTPPTATGGYPTAERTANPDQVLSPYEPYNVIDVAGFKSGKLVRDPSNQKIFRVP
jgi:hypothetical protein